MFNIKHAGHDHGAMAGMDMSGMDMSSTSTAAASATSTGMDMGGMDMGGMDMGGMHGMDMGGGCEMNMIWNWKTVDSCFLASGWHVKTKGQFAGTCIGVFLWVVFLVGFRKCRAGFDKYIVENRMRRANRTGSGSGAGETNGEYGAVTVSNGDRNAAKLDHADQTSLGSEESDGEGAQAKSSSRPVPPMKTLADFVTGRDPVSVRPSLLEQLIRALMFGFEYSIVWLLGLILMSFNGYVIISAFLGAAIGFFLLDWDRLEESNPAKNTANAPKCC